MVTISRRHILTFRLMNNTYAALSGLVFLATPFFPVQAPGTFPSFKLILSLHLSFGWTKFTLLFFFGSHEFMAPELVETLSLVGLLSSSDHWLLDGNLHAKTNLHKIEYDTHKIETFWDLLNFVTCWRTFSWMSEDSTLGVLVQKIQILCNFSLESSGWKLTIIDVACVLLLAREKCCDNSGLRHLRVPTSCH